MAFADTQKLVVELDLAGNFSRGIADARRGVSKLNTDVGKLNDTARRGLGTLSRNVALIGVAATAGIAAAVKTGLDDLAELENAITSIDGAISQLGLTGQLTGKQVADWANDIERDIEAAFDDKAIAQSATTLLRYGKVTPKALRPALEVVADLAAKTGDVGSASELLAKALADPAKAAGRLSRVGIILTDQQKDQIKTMTEAGDVAGAQALLLDAVAKSTKGAAKAMAGPYQDAINKTNDAMEDARKALAIGFLPVISKVADKLSAIVADPQALAEIKKFGESLAGGLDSLIGIAERLPWDAIGTSLRIGGMGAKAILDAFVALPPWVQTAVITGWGLNKLTGGALGSIVGELGKGLIKGVLGITAGTVIVNAKSVTGGGAPAAGGKGGGFGAGALAAGGIGVVVLGVTQAAAASLAGSIVTGVTGNKTGGQIAEKVQTTVGGGPVNLFGPFERIMRALNGDLRSDLQIIEDLERQQVTRQTFQSSTLTALKAEFATRQNIANERLSAIRAQAQATAAAARHAGQQTAAAIRDKDLSVKVTVPVSIRNYNAVTKQVNSLYRVAS